MNLKDLANIIKVKVISYVSENSDIKGSIIPSEKFLSLNITIKNYISDVYTQLIGNYNTENIVAAATIGNYFNIEPKQIKLAIEEYVPQNNRSQFIKTKCNNIILDAYNANPTSVNAAINNFISLTLENKILVLGDMLELGNSSRSEHIKILEHIMKYKFNKIILVGSIYSSINNFPDILKFANVNELMKWLLNNKITNTNILIKGSRGIYLEQIVNYL